MRKFIVTVRTAIVTYTYLAWATHAANAAANVSHQHPGVEYVVSVRPYLAQRP
jgi:hypothetical protein